MNKTNQTPPHNKDAEQSVLGSMLQSPAALIKVVPILSAEDFYFPQNQKLYTGMLDLFNAGERVDIVTVSSYLKGTDGFSPAYVASLTDLVPMIGNIESYATIVRSHAVERKLIESCQNTINECYDNLSNISEVLDIHQGHVLNLALEKNLNKAQTSLPEIKDSLASFIDQRFALKDPICGVPSGLYDLDKITLGFQDSDLVILAGRPSMGKTALALNMARYAAKIEKKPVGIFSLEMSNKQLGLRFVSDFSGVPIPLLMNGLFRDQDYPKIQQALEAINTLPIYLDDTAGIGLLELRAKARQWKMEHNIGMLVIDYMQLMTGSNQNGREQEINQISRGIKGVAKELNIPIIALSQLNRSLESRPNKRPQLSDLRDSGAIEQDADVIMFIYRDEVYNKADDNPNRGMAEIIVAKQRNGPTGMAKTVFCAKTASFENFVAPTHMPAYV